LPIPANIPRRLRVPISTNFKKIAEACWTVILTVLFGFCFSVLGPLIAKIGDAAWLVFGKKPKIETLADQEFASAVKATATLRKRGRWEYCDATQAFQQMAASLSLAGFRNYVFDRQESHHGKAVDGVYDLIDIPRNELRRYDRAFRWNEWLRITFSYADDGKTIVKFSASLLANVL
jgi:hypothetical protein